jgi:peptide/nickel transport system permease protein
VSAPTADGGLNPVPRIRSRARATTSGRRLLRRPLVVVGIAILVIYAGLAIVGPWFLPDPLATQSGAVLQPPSAEHWFGTDRFGRDIFARSVAAIRLDVPVGLTIAVAAMVVGSSIGVVAGYWGGKVDEVLMRTTDVLLAFPGFVLALIIAAVLGDSVRNLIIAVGVAYTPHFVRLTRAQVLSVRELEFVDAARVTGNRQLRVAFRHVLPNSLRPAMVQATLVTGWAILDVAGLAFLGVGIGPPTAEWGVMVAEGANDVIRGQWWTSLFPGAMIVFAVAAFHLIGDELEGSLR